MNYYNKYLFIKTVTRQTKIISSVLMFFCIVSYWSMPIQVSGNIQKLILMLLAVCAIGLLNSAMPSVKLRVYEYKLKFLSSNQLKVLLSIKVTYYMIMIYLVVRNIGLFTGGHFIIFEWLYLIICVKSIILKEVNLFEKLLIISFCAAVMIPGISIYLEWALVIIVFVKTEIIEPDYEAMEKMTFYLDNAFSSEFNEQEMLGMHSTKKKKLIQTSDEYIKYKVGNLAKKVTYLCISLLAISVILNMYGLSEHKRLVLFGVYYVFIHQILEQWLSEEKRVKNSKLYSNQKITEIIVKQSVAFTWIMMSVSFLIAIICGDWIMIVLAIITLAYVIITEIVLELSMLHDMILNFIFFGIISVLFFM